MMKLSQIRALQKDLHTIRGKEYEHQLSKDF